MTPPAWSAKDERQYEAVKQSLKQSGKSEERAKEIAARVVNNQRREEGCTPHRRTQGTGNPNTSLEERTVDQLQNIAANLNLSGRSTMRKDELIEAIRTRRGQHAHSS